MSLLVAHFLLSPTLMDTLPLPLRHGQGGILDEVLLFCAPIVVALLILAVSSQRARSRQERVRIRMKESVNLETTGENDTSQTVQGDEVEEIAP